MKHHLWLLLLLLCAASVSAACFDKVNSIPANCTGTITSDLMSGGCRLLSCANGANNISIKACDKSSGGATFFEMYKVASAGTSAKLCIGSTCMQNEGYVKSTNYPICVGDSGIIANWNPDAACNVNSKGTGNMVFSSGASCDNTQAIVTNTSIRFPGRATVANTLFYTKRNQTIRLWVYMNSYKATLNDQDTLFSTYDGNSRFMHSGFGDVSCANFKRFYIVAGQDSLAAQVVCSQTDPKLQQWMQVAVTVATINDSHSNITIYQDGQLQTSAIKFVRDETIGNLIFGDLGNLGRSFNGNLGPITIWNRTLGTQEIKDDYDTNKNKVFVQQTNLSTNLIAYYKEDGNHNDSKGSANGVEVGAEAIPTTGKLGTSFYYGGMGENAASLGGNDARVHAVLLGVQNWQAATVSLWVKPSTNFYQGSVLQFTESSTFGHRDIQGMANGGYQFTIASGNINPASILTPALSKGSWHHLVMQWTTDTKIMRVYVDGSLIDEKNITSFGQASDNLYWGGGFNGFGYNGRIDEIGIWNRTLSPSEVLQLYNAGNGKAYPLG